MNGKIGNELPHGGVEANLIKAFKTKTNKHVKQKRHSWGWMKKAGKMFTWSPTMLGGSTLVPKGGPSLSS